MKTLREYIDQLDEISRRDFLKGAGAAAAGAAIGLPKDAEAFDMTDQGWRKDPNVAYMAGYISGYPQRISDIDLRTSCQLYTRGVDLNLSKSKNFYLNGNEDRSKIIRDITLNLPPEQQDEAIRKHFSSACRKLVKYVETKYNLEIKESQLEETTDEVDRVVQLAKEMR